MKFFIVYIAAFFLFSCHHSQESIEKDVKGIAKEIMTNAKNCALVTIDSLGVTHVRVMDPFLPDENFTVWMATNPKSLKVRQIQNNETVTLFYFDQKTGSYVTLQGTASIVNNQAKKDVFWKKEWKDFYKNRTTDYTLIRFRPNNAKIISEKYQLLGDPITWEPLSIEF